MKTGFAYSVVALVALSVAAAATAAQKIAKGDDKYAETSNAKENDEKVVFDGTEGDFATYGTVNFSARDKKFAIDDAK